MKKKILDTKELSIIRQKYRAKKIVHCHGVFDLFHHGHLLYLHSAKKYGDILIVSITSDRYVNKGPGRPKFSQMQRANILASLSIVDYVFINDNPTAVKLFPVLKPDYYVKGRDYSNKKLDRTGGIELEEKSLIKNKGKLIFTDDEIQSSTSLINSFLNNFTKEQNKIIRNIKKKYSINEILHLIDELGNLKVFLTGEPIVDTYIFSKPMGISSKSPSISSRFVKEENYAGGSLAIAENLAELGCSVNLAFVSGNEDFFRPVINKVRRNKNIKFNIENSKSYYTPRKIRYIDIFKNQRIFELVHIPENNLYYNNKIFLTSLKMINESDLIMIADFGHGLMSQKEINLLKKYKKYTSINVQTNSENLGFNLFSKYKSFDYMSIDERECRLGMHDRLTDIVVLAKKIQKKYKKNISITLGNKGSINLTKSKVSKCPNFFDDIVDTTGAGDAYFAITSLLSKVSRDTDLISFIGNIYAGLATQIIGNKDPVSKISLIKSLKSILG